MYETHFKNVIKSIQLIFLEQQQKLNSSYLNTDTDSEAYFCRFPHGTMHRASMRYLKE